MARNKELKEKRNEALVKDFNHLFTKKRKRFDDCIEEISNKYFITKSYVQRIVSEHQNESK